MKTNAYIVRCGPPMTAEEKAAESKRFLDEVTRLAEANPEVAKMFALAFEAVDAQRARPN